ncbi:GumC family protein [Shinella sp. G-2]|uniref:GumC family protein n=1 Tax=Shinella sp. G-2 TaxID=3133141 RepID=UPI003CFD2E7E
MIWSDRPAGPEEFVLPRPLAVIVERRWPILACLAAGVAIAAVGYLDQPSRYGAEAVLALDMRKFQALPTESVVSPLPQESPVLRTEVDIISSRSMAERVLTQLQAAGIDAAKGFGLTAENAVGHAGSSARANRVSVDRRVLLDSLISGVRVTNDGRSYTIYVAFSGMEPEFTAAVANAYAEAYINYQVDVQTSATRRVSDWLGTRLVSLRSELERSEHAATSFREKSGIAKSNGTTLLSQQIAGLNAELARLRAQLAGLVARLATAVDVSDGQSGLAIPEVLNSPAIQQLRTEEARLKRLLAAISESGAVKNPQIPDLTSQLGTIQTQIGAEVEQIVDSLRTEIEVARRQQTGLEASLKQLQAEMSNANEAIVQADQLDREASANRAIYESYLTRYKQTIEQDGIAMAEARIISRAVPSGSPSSPNAAAWLIGGLVFGLAGGALATLLLELRAGFLRRPDPREISAGIPVIGRIPELSAPQRAGVADLIRHSREPFAHAIADMQGRLRLSARPGNVLVIAVTSAAASEGKTLVSSCLARSLAATGLRTLLLDANPASPGIAGEFGAQPLRTMECVCTRENVEFRELVRHDGPSGIDLICAGMAKVPAEHILGHDGFARLLSALRGAYDVVIVDSTAISNGSGALLVSALVDRTILVVPEGAEREDTTRAIRRFGRARIAIDGLVVNCAPRSILEGRNVASLAADHPGSSLETRKRVEMSTDLPTFVGL